MAGTPRSNPFITVAAALLKKGGRFLVTRRKSGLWEFPGGKREPGESLEEALRREIKEELDLSVAVGERFMRLTYPYPDRTVELHLFECRLVSGRPRTLGCLAWRWASPKEMEDLDFLAADEEVIQALKGAAD